MKLWFDEDLSHTLVQVAEEFGIHATCNRDRGMLGSKDPLLAATAVGEEYVFVRVGDRRVLFAGDDQALSSPCIAESSSWGLSPTAPHSNREGAGLRDETPQTAGNLRSTGACLRIDNTVREVPCEP